MSETPAVHVRDLAVRYHGGGGTAVEGVDFDLGPGEGLLITGDPGAGKTSLLRALVGLVPATGRVELFGTPPGRAAKRSVGYGPEGEAYASYLTVREVVGTVIALRGGGEAAREEALDRAGLSFVADYRTRRLDDEGLRRLSLSVAIAGDPDLVVLDDPLVLPETLDEIAEARARGAAVVAASRRPGGLAPALGRRMGLRLGRPA